MQEQIECKYNNYKEEILTEFGMKPTFMGPTPLTKCRFINIQEVFYNWNFSFFAKTTTRRLKIIKKKKTNEYARLRKWWAYAPKKLSQKLKDYRSTKNSKVQQNSSKDLA
jgi:hypothetical protein